MANTPTEHLSHYVRRVIKQKGLTLRDVERRSGGQITNGYVSGIMNGNITNLTVQKIGALAQGLGVDAHELFAAAYGKHEPPEVDQNGINQTDALLLVDLMRIVILNPDILKILRAVISLSPDRRKAVLETVERLRETAAENSGAAKSEEAV